MHSKIVKSLCVIAILFGIDYTGNSILKHYCEKGFGLTHESDILMVGHSHLAMSVNTSYLSKELGYSFTKYTRSGVDMQARHAMANQYMESKYADSLKAVVFCVDASTFTAEGLSSNSYILFYPWMDNDLYNDMVYRQASLGEYIFHKIFRMSRYNQDLYATALKGFLGSEDKNLKTNGLDLEDDPSKMPGTKIDLNPALMKELEQAIQDASRHNVKVILLQTPIAKYLLNGKDKEYAMVKDYYQSFADNNPNVYYIDFTDDISDKYDLFFNPTHLNVRGQELYTKRLCEELRAILL